MTPSRRPALFLAIAAVVTSFVALSPLKADAEAGHAPGTPWSVTGQSVSALTSQWVGSGSGPYVNAYGLGCHDQSFCAVGGVLHSSGSLTQGWFGILRNGVLEDQVVLPAPFAPSGGGRQGSVIHGAACSGESRCMVVGREDREDEGGSWRIHPMIQEFDGSSWSRVETPASMVGMVLDELSCVGPDFCMAAGLRYTSGSNTGAAAVYRDGVWAPIELPELLPSSVSDVSCVSDSYCLLLGMSTGRDVLIYDGAEVHQGASLPDNAEFGSSFQKVSCTAVEECTFSGGVRNGSTPQIAILGQLRGTSWREWLPPVQTAVSEVACTSADDCTATGTTDNGSNPYFARFNGSDWVPSALAEPSDTTVDHVSVDQLWCGEGNACMGVGGAWQLTSSNTTYNQRLGIFRPQLPVPVDVAGSQAQGSHSPTFESSTPGPGPQPSGTTLCTSVEGGTPISPSLAEGTYTIDGASCSGAVLSQDDRYAVYSGSFTVGAPATVPSSPELAAAGGMCCSGGVVVRWMPVIAPADGGDKVTGYTVTRVAPGGERTDFSVAPGPGNPYLEYIDSAVTDPHGYTYEIVATNHIGSSAPTIHRPEVRTAPGPVLNLAGSGQNDEVVLTWEQPASDGGSPIVKYDIYRVDRYTGDGPTDSVPGDQLTYTDTSVAPGGIYQYYVFAQNEAGLDSLNVGNYEDFRYVDVEVTDSSDPSAPSDPDPGFWSSLPFDTKSGGEHSADPMPDGRIGFTMRSEDVTLVKIWDPETEAYEELPGIPGSGTHVVRSILRLEDGRYAVIGARNSTTFVAVLDGASWSFHEAGPEFSACSWVLCWQFRGIVLPDGRVLVSGTTANWTWDPATDEFANVNGVGGTSQMHEINGQVYSATNGVLRSFDPTTDTWSTRASVGVDGPFEGPQQLFQVDDRRLVVVSQGLSGGVYNTTTGVMKPLQGPGGTVPHQIATHGVQANGHVLALGIYAVGDYAFDLDPIARTWVRIEGPIMPGGSEGFYFQQTARTPDGFAFIRATATGGPTELWRFRSDPPAGATVPAAPRITGYSCCSSGVKFTWSAVSGKDEGGVVISKYRVVRSGAGGIETFDIPRGNLQFTDPNGTADGQTYTVSAVNGIGESATTPVPIGEMDVAGPVRNLTATGNGKAVITWDAPESDGGSPIIEYLIIRADRYTGGVVPTAVVPADVRRYVDTDVQVGNYYEYYVYARQANGTDALSAGRYEQLRNVGITITPRTNEAPVTADASRSVVGDRSSGIVLSAHDADGDGLTFAVTDGPDHGSLVGDAPNLTYTPTEGYTGPDELTYSVDDGNGGTTTGTVAITVTSPESGISSVSQPVEAGQTVATAAEPSANEPATSAVTSPVPGEITITQDPSIENPAGYEVVGAQFQIEAPTASADEPLRLVFQLAESQLPPGEGAESVTVFRNGEAIELCDPDSLGQAKPDPCVFSRSLSDGVVRIEVLTSHASSWTLGVEQTETVTELASVAPSTYGEPVTLSATVATIAGGAVDGEVIFSEVIDGSEIVLGTALLQDGVAELQGLRLAAGTRRVRAAYIGKGTLLPSTSSDVELVVAPRAVLVTVTGTKVHGSEATTFSVSADVPDGLSLRGNVACTNVADGQLVNDELPAGNYVMDSSTCSGLALTGASAANHQVTYAGGTVVVAKAPVSVTTTSTSGLISLLTFKVTYSSKVVSAVNGRPIEGVKVTTRVNGGSPTTGCTAVTNAAGVATCSAGPFNVAVGVGFTAIAAESTNHNAGIGTGRIGLL